MLPRTTFWSAWAARCRPPAAGMLGGGGTREQAAARLVCGPSPRASGTCNDARSSGVRDTMATQHAGQRVCLADLGGGGRDRADIRRAVLACEPAVRHGILRARGAGTSGTARRVGARPAPPRTRASKTRPQATAEGSLRFPLRACDALRGWRHASLPRAPCASTRAVRRGRAPRACRGCSTPAAARFGARSRGAGCARS